MSTDRHSYAEQRLFKDRRFAIIHRAWLWCGAARLVDAYEYLVQSQDDGGAMKDYVAASACCREWRDMFRREMLWMQLFQNRWPHHTGTLFALHNLDLAGARLQPFLYDWPALYRQRHLAVSKADNAVVIEVTPRHIRAVMGTPGGGTARGAANHVVSLEAYMSIEMHSHFLRRGRGFDDALTFGEYEMKEWTMEGNGPVRFIEEDGSVTSHHPAFYGNWLKTMSAAAEAALWKAERKEEAAEKKSAERAKKKKEAAAKKTKMKTKKAKEKLSRLIHSKVLRVLADEEISGSARTRRPSRCGGGGSEKEEEEEEEDELEDWQFPPGHYKEINRGRRGRRRQRECKGGGNGVTGWVCGSERADTIMLTCYRQLCWNKDDCHDHATSGVNDEGGARMSLSLKHPLAYRALLLEPLTGWGREVRAFHEVAAGRVFGSVSTMGMGEAVLAKYKQKTGLVIGLGLKQLCVVPVWEGRTMVDQRVCAPTVCADQAREMLRRPRRLGDEGEESEEERKRRIPHHWKLTANTSPTVYSYECIDTETWDSLDPQWSYGSYNTDSDAWGAKAMVGRDGKRSIVCQGSVEGKGGTGGMEGKEGKEEGTEEGRKGPKVAVSNVWRSLTTEDAEEEGSLCALVHEALRRCPPDQAATLRASCVVITGELVGGGGGYSVHGVREAAGRLIRSVLPDASLVVPEEEEEEVGGEEEGDYAAFDGIWGAQQHLLSTGGDLGR